MINTNKLFEFAHLTDGIQREIHAITKKTSIRKKTTGTESVYDIGIITATPDEFNAIIKKIENIEEIRFNSNDSFIYYKGTIKNNEIILSVILSYPQGMGITAATIATTKILTFNPKYIFMVGVAAGNKNVTKIGDILVAEKALNYEEIVEVQKKDGNTSKKFMQNADSINKFLKSKFSILANKIEVFDEIKKEFAEIGEQNDNLKCHIGLMVTGSSLVRSQEKIDEINASYHGVIGLDMETYAVYYTCTHSLKDNKPYFVSIKSVSDFGDNTNHKLNSNDRKAYALHTSTSFLLYFIKNCMV